VLDLLPKCVSAVYFMYHEDVHTHGFGKLGALREIALAKEDGYQYWYAGFYIHSCVKMRYKGDYSPQYILDPETYSWVIFDDKLRKKLDTRKYVTENQLEESLDTITSKEIPKIPEDKDNQPMANPDCDAGSDEESPVPNPSLPIFKRSMPGLLSTEDILTKVDIDHIKIRIGDTDHETGELIRWEDDSITNMDSIKGIIAELVSAVGAELAGKMVVYFR
jgi:arginine-tRNA-protein transferase